MKQLRIDPHTIRTLAFRLWSVLAGAGTVAFISLGLSGQEQGYYFAFANILALQMFFELGLNQVVSQLASHESANAASTNLPVAPSDTLRGLLQIINVWYLRAAVGFFVLATSGGILFFQTQAELPPSEWLGAWVLTSAATAVNLWISPRLALLEGLGQVAQVSTLRLLQSLAGSSLMWLFLLSGMKLWSIPALPIVLCVASFLWMRKNRKGITRILFYTDEKKSNFSWKKDVLPLQWRTAVSWAASFLSLNLLVPVIFSSQGSTEAGQLGMALTIFASLTAVSMSWINAATPFVARSLAAHDRTSAMNRFKSAAKNSIIALSVSFLFFLSTAVAATSQGMSLSSRIPSTAILILIAANSWMSGVAYILTSYLRCHKQEPTWPIAIASATTLCVSLFQLQEAPAQTLLLAQLIITITITLPLTALTFAKYRQSR